MAYAIRGKRSHARARAMLLALLAALGAGTAGARAQGAPLVLDSISVGTDHACGLTPQHAAYCWGSNAHGQLGNPAVSTPCLEADQPCSATPVRVATSVPLASISAGNGFTCALSTSGVAYCWGSNAYAQLGIGSQVPARRPAKVAISGVTFRAISAGNSHACAVSSGGAAYCWGENEAGKVGTGRVGGGYTAPVPVAGHLVFRTISAGYFHSCGVTRTGEAYCWGRGNQGALGNARQAASPVPLGVTGPEAFREVQAAGRLDYSCGVDTAGAIWCWGLDCFNQLGVDSLVETCGTPPMPCAMRPSPVHAAARFAAVRVAFSHTCALTGEGAVLCWGDNDNGQLGTGNFGDRGVTPAAPLGGETYRALGVGRGFTCAVTAAGAAECWGLNDRGQLGIGADGNRSRPTPLAAP
jgi:alpha-tubulin suppressor-like RCC1 family protein